MNEISELEDENYSAENSAGNNGKKNKEVTPEKTVKKKAASSIKTTKAVSASKPAEAIKKVTPKKAIVQKPGAEASKPVKTKKAAQKKQSATETTTEVIKQPKKARTIKTAAQPAAAEQVKPTKQPELAKPELIVSNEVLSANSSALRKITFQIKFSTVIGQSLFVTGAHPLLGDNDIKKAYPLSYLNEDYWFATVEIPAGEVLSGDISYNYVLKNTDDSIVSEWGDKVIKCDDIREEELLLIDSWNASSFVENTYYTEPFQKVLLKESFTDIESNTPEKVTHIFRAKAPLFAKGEAVCIVGSTDELGAWQTQQPILLSRQAGEIWHTISLDLSNADFPFNYKYGVYDTNKNTFIQFEAGTTNRTVYGGGAANKLTIVSDGFAAIPKNGFKGAGVAIPVFSLRSNHSFGVGEFPDLKLMVDWAKKAGLKLVQLLPVNDTTATHTFTDSYPYAAISAFALHPLYLHLPAIVNKENHSLLTALNEKQAELNNKAEVDYVEVMKLKWELIKQIFPSQKEVTFKNGDFHSFYQENEHWLVPYAAFSYFREQNNTADFNRWKSNQTFDLQKIQALAPSPLKAADEISIYYYVQYHLHLQLKDATSYAHKNGIIVKGDIPIGIYRYSCDAWQQPELFNMNMQAGAPPDDFAVKGQNWGFPTYNWQKMREDDFTWWKKRFTQMSYYFDAFRIDHILGFFRIWSIPMDSVEGIMGRFVPAVPVHVNELSGRGIAFNYERFCQPYINEHILWEVFGAEQQAVKSQFLQASNEGIFKLKPEFDTQRKVELFFSQQADTELNRNLKQGLFNLISNVIFFEAEGLEAQFHFRIAMTDTASYKHLDSHTQYHLYELYVNYFFRRQDDFWMKEAMLKLPELKRSTNMLICGEDLGMVPDCVPGVMKELAILSLEIQRMPKDPKREFFHPNDTPYLSVVTPSTHDMSTVRGWWEEDRAATQRFFNNELGQWGTAPYFCEPWINRIIILQHLYSPAMWSIFQLQDLLGMNAALRRENPNEERINIPANPKHYWRYRMHIPLEALIKEDEFISELRGSVMRSGR